jgi:hypothetical protein
MEKIAKGIELARRYDPTVRSHFQIDGDQSSSDDPLFFLDFDEPLKLANVGNKAPEPEGPKAADQEEKLASRPRSDQPAKRPVVEEEEEEEEEEEPPARPLNLGAADPKAAPIGGSSAGFGAVKVPAVEEEEEEEEDSSDEIFHQLQQQQNDTETEAIIQKYLPKKT